MWHFCTRITESVRLIFISLDMDNWANYTQDDSWSYKNMLKYFKKSENYSGLYPSGTNPGS